MIRLTVIWWKSAQAELAEIWISSWNRNAITTATHAIDRELAEDADMKGVELSEGLRILSIPPLKVTFEVRDGDRMVESYRVRQV